MINLTEEDRDKSRIENRGSYWNTEKFWIKIDGVDFLYKSEEKDSDPSFQTKKCFGEKLYSNLSKVLDFDCVKAEFAKYSGQFPFEYSKSGFISPNEGVGILIETFLSKPNLVSVSYYDLINFYERTNNEIYDPLYVDTFLEVFKFFAKEKKLEYNLEEIKCEFYKRTILDFFLAQVDRNTKNIEFLIDDNKIFLAPSFDNSLCLSFGRCSIRCRYAIEDIIKKSYSGEIFKKFCFRPQKPFDIGCLHFNNSKIVQEEFFKSMIEICKENSNVKKFLKNLLKIDMEKEITQLEEECGDKLSKEMKTCSILMFDDKKKDFLDFLIKNKSKNKSVSLFLEGK